MRKFSVGIRVISWIYDRQLKGKMLWVPIGETSGFFWMLAIDAVILGLIVAGIWIWL